ncbi:MAG: LEPR-XLL domain-containing protein [Oceanospirillaceae bacterium]
MVIHQAARKNTKPLRLNGLVNKLRNAPLNRLFAAMKKPVKAELNAFQLEQLEPRLLLSADPFSALALTAAADVTLQIVEVDDQQVIQLINNNAVLPADSVLASESLSSIAAGSIITINGSDDTDKFTVDQSFLDLGERDFMVRFDGGTAGVGESDSITVGVGVSGVSWQLESAGQGKLASLNAVTGTDIKTHDFDLLEFSGIEAINGSGSDYLDFSLYSTAVTVDLTAGTATGLSSVSGMNTVLGSAQADTLKGDNKANQFSVSWGDNIDGVTNTNSTDEDKLYYVERDNSGLDIRLSLDATDPALELLKSGAWDGTAFTATDTLATTITSTNIDVISLIGGGGDNYYDLSATSAKVVLNGGAGNDHLIGGAQADILIGLTGNDTLDGGAGFNLLEGGYGNDTLTLGLGMADGGDGIDSINANTQASNVIAVETFRNKTVGQNFLVSANTSDNTVRVNATADDDHFSFRYEDAVTKSRIVITNGSYSQTVDALGVLIVNTGAGSDTVTFKDLEFSSVTINSEEALLLHNELSSTGDININVVKTLEVEDNTNITAGGDLDLSVSATVDVDLRSVLLGALNPFSDELKAEAKLIIGAAAQLKGTNVTLQSRSKTNKYVDFQLDNALLNAALNGFAFAELGKTWDPATVDPENIEVNFSAGDEVEALQSTNNADFSFFEKTATQNAGVEISATSNTELWRTNLVNKYITFTGNTLNSGVYKVTKVEGAKLYFEATTEVTVQTITDVAVKEVLGASITRVNDAADWDDDGFLVGQIVKIIGSGSLNDDSELTVLSISGDKITFVPTESLIDEAITGDDVTVKQMYKSLAKDVENATATAADGSSLELSEGAKAERAKLHSTDQDALIAGLLQQSGILDISMPFEHLLSTSTSSITIDSSAVITSTADLSITSKSVSSAVLNTPGGSIAGAIFVDSNSTSSITIASDVLLASSGKVDIISDVLNNVVAKVEIGSGLIAKAVNKLAKIPAPSLAFAYAKAKSDSSVTIAKGTITAANEVSINSNIVNDYQVSAIGNGKSGAGAAAFALTDFTSNSDVDVSTDITAASAQLGANSANLEHTVQVSATAKGMTKVQKALMGYATKKIPALADPVKKATGPAKLEIGAGLAIVQSDNAASLKFAGKINVTDALNLSSFAQDNYRVSVLAGAKSGAKIALAGAVSYGNFGNTASTIVANTADINAGDVTISSKAEIPDQVDLLDDLEKFQSFQLPPSPGDTISTASPIEFLDTFDTYQIQLKDELDNLTALLPYLNKTLGVPDKIATSYVAATSKSESAAGKSVSASVNIIDTNNTATTEIGDGAVINASGSAIIKSDVLIDTINVTGIPDLKSALLGSTSGGKGIGGSVQWFNSTSKANTKIGANAVVIAQGELSVTSHNRYRITEVGQSSGKSSDKGISVNVMYNEYLGESKVSIDDSATLVGQTITVSATQDTDAVAVGLGIQRGGSQGAGASVVINDMDTQTIAAVAADVSATTANQLNVTPGLNLQLTGAVLNRDTGDWLADGFRAGQLVAVTMADNSVQQIRIADVSDTALTFVQTPTFATAITSISVQGSMRTDETPANTAAINIIANNEVDFFALAAAAAITGSKAPASPEPTDDGSGDTAPTADSVKQSTGVGVAGSVAINLLNNTVLTSVTNTVLSSLGDISLKADNDVSAIAITGSASKSTGISLAGSFSHNDITQNIQANIENSQVNAHDLTVQSEGKLRLINISAGGSFTSGTKAKAALYGSVNINDINSTVTAQIVASEVTLTGSLTVDAKLTSSLNSFAGGAAVGGKAAIGAAVDILNVVSNVNAAIKSNTSGSTQSVIEAVGDVSVNATTDQNVIVGTVSLAGSKEKLAASGAITILDIAANTTALISNSQITTQGDAALEGTLSVSATDTLNLIAFAGTIAASRGAALGGAYSGNRIKSDAQARLESATIDLKKGSVTVVGKTDLNLTSVAISGAVVAGSKGIGAALSGAIINNDIDTTTYATLSNSNIVNAQDVSLSATDDSSISADAGGVALAVTKGPGGSVGVSVAVNDVQSNIRSGAANSSINASGDLSISSKTIDSSIEVFALSGSVALSGGSAAIAIAATVASNVLGGKVESFISDDRVVGGTGAAKGNIKAASISLTSVDEAKINSFAIGASISGTTGTGSASIGVSIADNTLSRSALASIDGTASIDISTGTLGVSASNKNIIEAKAIAASVAVTASTGSSFSLSGAGAKSSNVVNGDTLAYIKNTDILQAGDVTLSATNTSSLDALIVGVSIAASGGSGAAIGVAIAENKIGSDAQSTKVQSYLEDTKVNTSKALTLASTANMDISAVVAAGSVAISAGSSAGLVGAGSGVSSTNDIYTDVASYIDNTGNTSNTIQALGLALTSLNASKIDTTAGSVSIGARVGSGGNATLVIGVALASNTIDNNTRAYILGVSEVNVNSANVIISATSNNTITSTSFAASLAVAIGSGGSASIAGAGADATNVINGTTAAYIKNSSLIGASQLTLQAKNTSRITAEVIAVAAGGAGGAGGGLGISIGAALANNDIGTSAALLTVAAYLENAQVTVAGLLNVQADNGMTINATVVAGAMAVAAGSGPSGAGAGSGVDTTNNIYAKTLASIDNSSDALTRIKAGTMVVQATDRAQITATAAAVSVAIAAGSGPALSISVGVSIAENNINTITTAQVIGKGSATSQALPQISAGSLAVLAKDTSIIKADVVGASVSASVSGSGSLSLSVAAVLAENNVSNAVTARIQSIDVETRNGGVEVNANENATVELLAAAASVSLAGGTAGIALSGAGVKGTNTVGNQVNAYIDDSKVITQQRYDYVSNSLTGNIDSGDLVEFANGVYQYNGANIDVRPDYTLDGYAYDAQGNPVGAKHSVIEQGDKIRFSTGTYLYQDAGNLALATGVAEVIAGTGVGTGPGARWVKLVDNIDLAALKNNSPELWSLAYSSASYVQQDIKVNAINSAKIDSSVGAVSAAVAVGAVGVAGSIGVTLSENVIGNGLANDSQQTNARISNSSIRALNDVQVIANSVATIDSYVLGSSISLAGGKVAIALAGAGIDLDNDIHGQTKAYVANTDLIALKDLKIDANANGQILKAKGDAITVSAAIGIGGAAAISATIINNDIAMDVDAYLQLDNNIKLGSSIYQVMVEGNVDITSFANADFKNVKATSVTFSGGLVGLSGGGVDITNTVNNQVSATASGNGALFSTANFNLNAHETTELSIDVTNIAASASIGGALGVALVRNDVRSKISARLNDLTIDAQNIDVLAKAENKIIKTKALGFSAALLAASANRADISLETQVAATTDSATLNAQQVISINAESVNYARADANGGAAGGIAVGAMIADIEHGKNGQNEVLVQLGDNTKINATQLRVKAYGSDDILARTIAAAGGLVAGAGAQSSVTSYQNALASVGKGVNIEVEDFDISSVLDQNIDASADAFSVGLASGSGAGLDLSINSRADVVLGASTRTSNQATQASEVLAHRININAVNNFNKDEYPNGKSLRTGSANLVGANGLYSTTTLNNHANISLLDNIKLIGEGSYDDQGLISIEAYNNIETIDNITIETVSGLGSINAAFSVITANSTSSVNVNGAIIENITGSVYITAKTDSENRGSADILAVSGLGSAANANAIVKTNADNLVNLSNANIKVGDLYVYAGKSRQGVLNILESSANTEMTSVSAGLNISVPNPDADIREINKINFGEKLDIKAMQDVTIEAREGIGGPERAMESGLTLSISGIPYGSDIDREGSVISNNDINIASTAHVIAGVNNKTFLQIRTADEVAGILSNHVDAQGVLDIASLSTAQKKFLFGVENKDGVVVVPELPADVVYVIEALGIDQIKFKLSQDTVIHHNGEYFQYLPRESTEVVLGTEDYSNSRWKALGSSLSPALQDAFTVYESTVTENLSGALGNEFYVVKPRDLDAPTLTFTNLSTILLEQQAQVLDWITSHSTNAEAIARYQIQLADINSKIDKLGLVDYVHSLTAGQIVQAPDQKFYANLITEQLVLESANYSDVSHWQEVSNPGAGSFLHYSDTASASSKVYNEALDILMIDLPNVYASPGSVYIQIDGKSAETLRDKANRSNLKARAGATIQIVNTAPFSLRVNDVVVKDTQRVEVINGVLKTFTPGAVQLNYKDVNSIAIRGDSIITGGADTANTPAVEVNEIIIFQDTKVANTSFSNNGVTFALPKVPANMYIQGNVVNENGDAYINNRDGAIEVSKQIRARTINLFAAGDFTLNSEAWYHSNKDPRQYINLGDTRSKVYNVAGTAKSWNTGIGATLSATVSSEGVDFYNAINADNSQILSMGKITITARHLNVNGLIQSGVNTIALTIDANFYGGRNNVDLSNKKGQSIAGISFANPGSPGNVKVPVSGYWDADRKAIVVEDILASGGEVVIAGQVISTGNGRIVAASGFAAVKVVNNSAYNLILDGIDTRQYREGKITIIDSQELTKDEYSYNSGTPTRAHFQGQLVAPNPTTGAIATINYVEDVNFSGSTAAYEVNAGSRYVWTEGQAKTKTEIRLYQKKSFNLFGGGIIDDFLVKDASYKWKTVEFTQSKPLLESESVVIGSTTSPDYEVEYIQTAGDTSVNSHVVKTWTTGGGWLRKKTVNTKITTIEGLKDYYTHSLKADYSIGISFLGGNANANVDITSVGNIIVAGAIKIPDQGLLKLHSTGGSVMMADGVYALTKQVDIFARNDISVLLEGNLANRGHTLIAALGSINLGVVEDDNPGSDRFGKAQTSSNVLYIDTIYARQDVNINAGGGIYKSNTGANTTISANNINLLALGGGVGHLNIDSATFNNKGTVTVDAQGNIALTEVNGNLNVSSIVGAKTASTGSAIYGVQLSATNGSILDANLDEVRTSGIDTSNAQKFYAESLIVNEATDDTTLYHQYWQILRADNVAYNSDVTTYANYTNIYSHLNGKELNQAQVDIAALNASFNASSEHDPEYDKLALLKEENLALPVATNSEFKVLTLAKIAANKPIFDSILSPGIVAKLYPGTPLIVSAGAGNQEVANIESVAAGSTVTLNAYAGLGKIGSRVVINMANGVNGLSVEHKSILTQATGSDVVASQYSFYRYIGAANDISQFDINYSDGLWQAVTTIDAATSIGAVNIATGNYVEVDQDGVPALFKYTGANASINLAGTNYEAAGAPWDRVVAQSVAPAATLDLVTNEIVMQLETVTIQLWDDLNLAGAGSLTAIANQGIAIEHNGNLIIDRIEGGSWVRLTAAGSITDSGQSSVAALKSAGDIVLVSRSSIQAADTSAFRIQATQGSELNLDAGGAVNIWQVEGTSTIGGVSYQIKDLRIGDVAATGDITISAGLFSTLPMGQTPTGSASIVVEKISTTTGTVALNAAANILDGYDDSTNAIINIRAKDLILVAGAAVGIRNSGKLNYVDLKLSGSVSAKAQGDIMLNSVESHLVAGFIETDTTVYLKASESILDSEQDNDNQPLSLIGNADVKAHTVELLALKGGIGQFGNQLEIDTNAANGGQLSSYSNKDSYIRETTGDLRIASLVADSDNSGKGDADIYLTVDANIVNALPSGHSVIASGLRIVSGENIGQNGALRTLVDNLEAHAIGGSITLLNTGHLTVGGVSVELVGVSALQNITLSAQSPLSVNENIIAQQGDIILNALDDASDAGANADDLTINSALVEAVLGSLTLNAGDALTLEQGGTLKAAITLTLNTDIGNSDTSAGTVTLHGTLEAANTVVNTGSGNDSLLFNVQQMLGDVQVNAGAGLDTITVNELVSRSSADYFELDGQGGTDTYIINRTGQNLAGVGADYIINVRDSGTQADGADTLTINGTDLADTLLLRKGFVAALHDDNSGTGDYQSGAERINYDRNINGRLILNGHEGNDAFFSDDNSSITTLDGGAGDDSFQIGQLYGLDRQAALGTVALGDEIETTETTLGFLSKGNSLPMVVYGGDGEDTVKVYSNKALTKLYGEYGDDSFVVRAFLKKGTTQAAGGGDVELFGGDGADNIQYSINSPLKIDGGAGTDSVIVLGTEGDDSFMVTKDGIFGAGLNVSFTGVELAEVDGLEGDDTFYILSTSDSVVTTIIGGLGADTFNVAGDVTTPIVSYSVEGRSSFINHSVVSDDGSYNGIFVDGVSLSVANKGSGAVQVDTDNGVLVSEEGGSDSYELSLNLPTSSFAAYVTISAARASTSDKTRSGASANSILVSTDNINFYESLVVTRNTGNWTDTATIYVKAVDDTATEGLRDYVISHSVRSVDAAVDGIQVDNVAVQVLDNDQADIIVNRVDAVTGYATLAEGGTGQQYEVRLATQPKVGEIVTVSLAQITKAGVANQLSLSTNTLTFSHTNWDTTQQFTLTAFDDAIIEDKYLANVTLSTVGVLASGASYLNVVDTTINVNVLDNDTGAVIVTQTNGSTLVTDTQSDSYSLVLSKQPTATVTIRLLNDGQTRFSSLDTRFNEADNTVTFDASNWSTKIDIVVAANPAYIVNVTQQPTQNPPLQPHTLNNIRGQLIIEGGVPADKQRTLSLAVMLPSEIDGALPILELQVDESLKTDTLNIFNDGSVRSVNPSDSDFAQYAGILSETSLTGLGMGQGIFYNEVEVLDTFLGRGNDHFTITSTASDTITQVHGGGGDDFIQVTGSNAYSDAGAGVMGALILFGDSEQDGSTYNATSDAKTNKAREFSNPGNDTIDASGAGGSVTIYGGQGNDNLTGGEFGDQIAGGSGDDQLYGLGGNDHLYGDSGFNTDVTTRLNLASQVLTLVNIESAANDNLDTSDRLQIGSDHIEGGQGNDFIFGDRGEVVQASGTKRVTSTGDVQSAQTLYHSIGAADTLIGDEGNDRIFGGFGADNIAAGSGNDSVIGDNGRIILLNSVRSQLFSTDTSNATGDNDIITLGAGEDQAIAGIGSDTVTNLSGETVVLGDNGIITSDASGRYIKITTGAINLGGNDLLTGGIDRDILFGGVGADTLDGAAGDDILGGDGSQVTRRSTTIQFEAIDLFTGGDDILLGGAGLDRMIGGFGSDGFEANFREDVLVGEYARFTFSTVSGNELATSVISLAQGGLDLIRQTQTGVFNSFAQQVFAQSDLGAVAQSRTAVATGLSADAQQALGRLGDAPRQSSSSPLGGVDYILPQEPTAAGGETVTGEAVPEDGEGEYDEDGFLIPSGEGETDVPVNAEGTPVDENGLPIEAEECVINADGVEECSVPEQAPIEEAEAGAEVEAQEEASLDPSSTLENTSAIDVHAALASFTGWAVMRANPKVQASRQSQG